MTWLKALLAACALGACVASAACAGPEGPEAVNKALLWSLVPGGGHVYLGERGAGAWYFGTTLSLLGAGVWLEQRNEDLGRDDEVNTFWLLGLKEWEFSLFTTYRQALRASGVSLRTAGVDAAPAGDLCLEPFRRRNLANPWVILAAAAGAGAAALDAAGAEFSHGDVRDVGILGMDANREWGTGLYGADAFALDPEDNPLGVSVAFVF